MGEVRRYFCCTDNLSGCKILGGVQLTFVGYFFILVIIGNGDRHLWSDASHSQPTSCWGSKAQLLPADGLVNPYWYGNTLLRYCLVQGSWRCEDHRPKFVWLRPCDLDGIGWHWGISRSHEFSLSKLLK